MSLPTFKREDLRDHADPARIDRVWSRLESDLPAVAHEEAIGAGASHRADLRARPAATRRARAALLLAASLAAFGGGVLVGRDGLERDLQSTPVATATQEAVDVVLAAGTRSRTFSLPGGGVVTLLPGGTMEIGEVDGGVVALRLVQGEAAVESAGGGSVAIEAGEARVSTIGASTLSVRRDERAIDVSVTGGLVEVDAPDGRKTLRGGERTTASTVVTTAVLDAPPIPRAPEVRMPSEPPPLRESEAAPPPQAAPLESLAAVPGWFALYEAGKIAEAKAQLPPAEMAAAIERGRTASELMALDILARSKGEKVLAMRALTRVATEFPNDPWAKIAAMTLGNMHRDAGNHALATQFEELAMSSQFAEDIACRRIASLDSRAPRAADTAREYLAKFPDGRCRTAAEDLLSDAEADAIPREDGEAPAAEDEGAGEPGAPPAPGAAGVEASGAAPGTPAERARPAPAAPAPGAPAAPAPGPGGAP